MSETRSRSRSRSPGRDANNAPADNNAPPADDYKQDNGGGAEEEVKLYVGNLDYGKIFWNESETETEKLPKIKSVFSHSLTHSPFS